MKFISTNQSSGKVNELSSQEHSTKPPLQSTLSSQRPLEVPIQNRLMIRVRESCDPGESNSNLILAYLSLQLIN